MGPDFKNSIINLTALDGFMPHGQCLLWQPDLLALHVISDIVITLSYYSIPIALMYFVKKRQDLNFSWVFMLFSLFIFFCGTTHLMGVITIWKPYYWLDGGLKAATAVASILTAVILWPLIPKALAIPSAQAMVQSEKLAALGRVTGTVAHEFNNPLQGVHNILSILRNSNLNDEEIRFAEMGMRECNRMGQLIRGLRDYYRPTQGVISTFDLHEQIVDTATLFKKAFEEKAIEVKWYLSEEIPQIRGIEDQIKQVLLNLFQNAVDAIPDSGGTISVSTRIRESQVEVEIEDTGGGIEEKDVKKVFEPFYTTKGPKGTGLGLFISYNIVEQHGGSIQAKNRSGRGAVLTLCLPVIGSEVLKEIMVTS